jgi:hypothetical protein
MLQITVLVEEHESNKLHYEETPSERWEQPFENRLRYRATAAPVALGNARGGASADPFFPHRHEWRRDELRV